MQEIDPDYDRCDPYDEHRALFVFDKKMPSFANAALGLFAISGTISKPIDSIGVYWHTHPEKTMHEVSTILQPSKGKPETVLIYDQSGTLDDIACFKSNEVEPITLKRGAVKSYGALPKFDKIAISDDKKEEIGELARAAAVQVVLSKLDSVVYKECESTYVQDAVCGISLGNLECPINEDDIENWRNEYADRDYYAAAYLLAAEGYIEKDADFEKLIACVEMLPDMLALWKYCAVQAGIPIVFGGGEKMTVSTEGIRMLGEMLGVDSAMDAYLAGVPMEDIMA